MTALWRDTMRVKTSPTRCVECPAMSSWLTISLALAALATPLALRAQAEPAVQRTVVEDDGVRIEETRVRGQLQRVGVRSKVGGARPYEIVTGDPARDPAQERRAAGQRVWHILSF
jgi:hypothetical protein